MFICQIAMAFKEDLHPEMVAESARHLPAKWRPGGAVRLYVGRFHKLPEPKAIIKYARLTVLPTCDSAWNLLQSIFKRGTISEGFRIVCQVCSNNSVQIFEMKLNGGLKLRANSSNSGWGNWSFRDPVHAFHRITTHFWSFLHVPAPLSICRRRWSKELASSGSVLA